MNNEQLRLLVITFVAILFGMLATALLPLAYAGAGLGLTIITVMVLLTRR